MGGGDPHRFDLSSSVIIKDNHLKLMSLKRLLERRAKSESLKKIEGRWEGWWTPRRRLVWGQT